MSVKKYILTNIPYTISSWILCKKWKLVNSNILLENGMSLSSITLAKYGKSIHMAPDGKEGHEYTAEEVYDMLPPSGSPKKTAQNTSANSGAKKQPQSSGRPAPPTWDNPSR